MAHKKAELIELSDFRAPVHYIGAAIATAKISVEGEQKRAMFFIDGVSHSVLANSGDSPDRPAKDAIEGGVIDNHEIEDTYYFEYTGSHFHLLDEKPEWATAV